MGSWFLTISDIFLMVKNLSLNSIYSEQIVQRRNRPALIWIKYEAPESWRSALARALPARSRSARSLSGRHEFSSLGCLRGLRTVLSPTRLPFSGGRPSNDDRTLTTAERPIVSRNFIHEAHAIVLASVAVPKSVVRWHPGPGSYRARMIWINSLASSL